MERVEEEKQKEAEGEERGTREDAEENDQHAADVEKLLGGDHFLEGRSAQTREKLFALLCWIDFGEKRLTDALNETDEKGKRRSERNRWR